MKIIVELKVVNMAYFTKAVFLNFNTLSLPLIKSLPDHFSFEIHQVWNMLNLARPGFVSLKNKSQNTNSVLWNPTKVINPWTHEIIRQSIMWKNHAWNKVCCFKCTCLLSQKLKEDGHSRSRWRDISQPLWESLWSLFPRPIPRSRM